MRVGRYMRLGVFSFGRNVAGRMTFRADFFLALFGMLFSTLLPATMVLVIYGASTGFLNWSLADMLLLTGMVSLGEGAAFCFIAGIIWNTYYKIEKGEFDVLLLAPADSLAYLIARSSDVEDLGKLLGGIIIFSAGVVLAKPTLIETLLLLLLSILPFLFVSAIGIFAGGASIRWVNTMRMYEFMELFTRGSKFPIDIYPKALSTLFLTAFPIGVIGFIPVGVVRGLVPALALGLGVFVVALLLVSIWFYNNSLKHYQSAGG